ncbi:MAG: PepSY domain-containing protein [Candidatus Sulfotelmatobacter sp.]
MKMRDFVRIKTAIIGDFTRSIRSSRSAASRTVLAVLLVILALLAACDSNTSKTPEAKPEPKGPELLTGRAAFQKVFIAARNYAIDAKPFRIESVPTTDANGHDGKSAVWRASFASPTVHGVKPFIWSGSNAPDAPSRGVSPGNEDVYNPTNASTQIFDVAFLKIDSDQAFDVAQKHGGDKILEKDPSTPAIFICDWNHNTNQLVWHVIYGSDRDNSKLTVAVNATTGEFIRVEK